jgi:glycosyltransferase involved in cell wall biosynthesis
MKCPTCPVAGPCHADHPSRGRLCQLIASGRGDYRQLVVRKSAGLAESPADTLRGPTPPPGNRVVYRAHALAASGFGRMAWRSAEAIERQGVPVAVDPILNDAPPGSWLASRIEPDAPDPWRLWCAPIGTLVDPGHSVAWTMYETTGLPAEWVTKLNRCRAVVVPTAWNAEAWRAAGVTAPLHVCPLGHDPAEGWAPGPRRDGGPFRVLMLAELGNPGVPGFPGRRKGFPEGVEAFRRAFGDDAGVELVVKCMPDDLPRLPPLPPNARLVCGRLDLPELVALYQSADVFLSPSYGEGWNLPLLEAMACGVPVVATDETAHRAFHGPDTGYVVRSRRTPAAGYYAGHGDWFVPDVASIAACLRRAYHNPEERRAKGMAAVQAARSLTWSNAARTLVGVLRDVGMLEGPPSPRVALLRRAGRCPHRERCGCSLADCRMLGRKVTLDECAGCPELPV